MAENSKIEWTDHTFNPWIGCTKVSPGCAHCYAETLMDSRLKQVNWGKGQPRKRTSESNWAQPLKWNNEYVKAHPEPYTGMPERPRVFCASLADWLDPEVPIEWLADLLELIRKTPHLDWLLLTKRPELWRERMQALTGGGAQGHVLGVKWLHGRSPANVWVGTSVEDQKRADERIPALLEIPAKIRFLSCEPLLGRVELRQIPANNEWNELLFPLAGKYIGDGMNEPRPLENGGIHWVIVGGESGANARPMEAEWVRFIREQCKTCKVPFLFKQWGEWAPNWFNDEDRQKIIDSEWMDRMGKKAAGRVLDGVVHDGFPVVIPEVQIYE